MAMMFDLTGQQMGDYRLVRFLGAGAFASVYLGENVHLPSFKVAVKVLHLFNVDQTLFQREAETMVSLIHPHIVRLLHFAFQQDSKLPFLVMDYAPGGSLLTKHPRGTQVPLTKVVQYTKDIASALQYAHEQRIIHRDVKPENILLGRSGEVLLGDFGIAMLSKTGRTSLDVTNHKAGTPYYMAPEMIRGKPEKASDQYALGIVVYELLCGTPPFTEGDQYQLGMQHLVEPVPALRDKLPSLSPRVEAVILKALAKKPEDRFPSVQAFAEALEDGIIAPPPRKTPPIGTRLLIYSRHSDAVYSLAWSPDNSRIASGSADKTVQVWEVKSGQILYTYRGHSDKIYIPAWSSDGSRIASGSSDTTVRIWNVSNGKILHIYRGHSNWVFTVAWSPDGLRIASGSEDQTVQIWEVSTGRRLLTYNGHSNAVYTLAWSPDGSRIASGSADSTVQVWEANSGRLLHTLSGHSNYVWTLAWSPDGSRIASGSSDTTVQVWEANSGRLLLTYRGHSDSVPTVAWSPDSSRIASGSWDHTVQVWEVSSRQLLHTYRGHSSPVHTLAWSPDGSRIASGSADMTVQVWQAE